MKPLSDKQAQAISKLYPQLVWDEIRNLSAQEASQMISEKWGDSKPRNSPGWRTEPQMSKSLPISQPKAPNGARIGCAVNNAVALLAPRFKSETTIESMTASIESMSREILKIMDKLEKE